VVPPTRVVLQAVIPLFSSFAPPSPYCPTFPLAFRRPHSFVLETTPSARISSIRSFPPLTLAGIRNLVMTITMFACHRPALRCYGFCAFASYFGHRVLCVLVQPCVTTGTLSPAVNRPILVLCDFDSTICGAVNHHRYGYMTCPQCCESFPLFFFFPLFPFLVCLVFLWGASRLALHWALAVLG